SQASLTANEVSFGAAISACEAGRMWQLALGLLSEMRATGARPDIMSCGSALRTCQREGLWCEALVLVSQMATLSVTPDVVSLSEGVSACDRGGHLLPAARFLASVQASAVLGVQPWHQDRLISSGSRNVTS
ncbi:unnamed protein product, partial [Polarella glacialis]